MRGQPPPQSRTDFPLAFLFLVSFSLAWALFNQEWRISRIVVYRPRIRKRAVKLFKVAPTTAEATEHIRARHVVSTLSHAGVNATQRESRRRQAQVGDFDPVAGGFPMFEALQVNPSA